MDIRITQLQLIEMLLNTKKESVLQKIKLLLEAEENENDSFDDLPKEIQNIIEQSRESIKSGSVFSHENVMNEAREKYKIK